MSPPPNPLRVALIGLSASATTSWAANGHLPSFKTAAGRARFTIAALLNSSVPAAQAAITAFDLNPGTKAYGNPEDVAKDPDIDLVVCNTRVDKHYETVLPSLKAGKDVYVEWPIATNAMQIEDLMRVAKEKGSKVAVGLQGRWAAPVLMLKELVREGKLGKVLSSELRAYGGSGDREILPTGLKYFAQREVGGNPMNIAFGHRKLTQALCWICTANMWQCSISYSLSLESLSRTRFTRVSSCSVPTCAS